ncbi:hypothetical protein R5R53_07305 [Oenococcus oeni]
MVRRLMIDHTFVFPRMIWMFGIFVLAYLGYSPIVLLLSVIFMYLLYVFDSFLNFINVRMFLKNLTKSDRSIAENGGLCLRCLYTT